MLSLSPYKHVIRSQQFTFDYIEELFDLTDFMKKNEFDVSSHLQNRIVAMLFYEPSTRTRLSFDFRVLNGDKNSGIKNIDEAFSKFENLKSSVLY